MGLPFTKHLSLPTYITEASAFIFSQMGILHLSRPVCSHLVKDIKMFDNFSNFLVITGKHKDSISETGSTSEVSFQAVGIAMHAPRNGPDSINNK